MRWMTPQSIAGHGTYNNKTISPRQVIGNQKLLVSVLSKPKTKDTIHVQGSLSEKKITSQGTISFLFGILSLICLSPTFIHPLLVWRGTPATPPTSKTTPPLAPISFPSLAPYDPWPKHHSPRRPEWPMATPESLKVKPNRKKNLRIKVRYMETVDILLNPILAQWKKNSYTLLHYMDKKTILMVSLSGSWLSEESSTQFGLVHCV